MPDANSIALLLGLTLLVPLWTFVAATQPIARRSLRTFAAWHNLPATAAEAPALVSALGRSRRYALVGGGLGWLTAPLTQAPGTRAVLLGLAGSLGGIVLASALRQRRLARRPPDDQPRAALLAPRLAEHYVSSWVRAVPVIALSCTAVFLVLAVALPTPEGYSPWASFAIACLTMTVGLASLLARRRLLESPALDGADEDRAVGESIRSHDAQRLTATAGALLCLLACAAMPPAAALPPWAGWTLLASGIALAGLALACWLHGPEAPPARGRMAA
ncbi:hypothetical protein [Actinoalloteichus caeruleus]|uniref:hypothetical protein n=1 Tax=Actinoalloteichus cyanogriseus TaxID=2893586 RepID=UPI0004AAFEC7|nr:hypothetical protein [Actinoalloteichus caeruleus]